MKTKESIVFNKPDLGEEEMSMVMDVIRSGWLGTGKISHQFEEEFADFMGGGYCVAVGSCSIGLQMALDILPEGEVITTPLTFAATLNAIIHSGHDPVLVDVDHRGLIDIEDVSKRIDGLTRAVVPVHYSGDPVYLGGLDKNVMVIEDCAHAFGMKNVLHGTIKVYSFYPNKNITSGEGGMVWTKDKDIADKIRVLSSQGLSLGSWERFGKGGLKTYQVEKVGYKGNMPDILAAIGITQLRRWPEIKQKRDAVWKVYEQAFGQKHPGHAKHFYPIRIKNRDEVRAKLFEKGIGTGVHYNPLHLEPAYRFLGYKKGDFPMAELWGETELSLPVNGITEEEAKIIIGEIE